MKLFKSALRWWITLASTLGFVTGWVMLARSSEAALDAANQPDPAPGSQVTVPLVPSLESLLEGNVQLSPMQSYTLAPSTTQNFQPTLRTGGS